MNLIKRFRNSPHYKKLPLFYARHEFILLRALIFAGFFAAAGAYMIFGPARLVELTETPRFCALCHSSQDRDWLHSAHRGKRCIDCHLPNNNPASHYLWKSIDGGKDVFFQFSGLGDGNDTELTAHGKKVLQANCVRCHADMVSRVDGERNCVSCHRPLAHRLTAAALTRNEEIKNEKP